MKAKVRRFHSPDVYDLKKYVPEDPEYVGVLIQIMAGPEDGPGEESFDVVVCTPRWLEWWVQHDAVPGQTRNDPLVGRHYLVAARWDSARVLQFLTAAVESEEAPRWNDLALRIGRIGRWEFEDYKEDKA